MIAPVSEAKRFSSRKLTETSSVSRSEPRMPQREAVFRPDSIENASSFVESPEKFW